jgi:hypothetical protein
MEDSAKMIESLVEKATDYGETSYELVKLIVVDKSSEIVSVLVPHSIVFVLFASFMLFLNLGLALWLGELLGGMYYGFFVIAAFYILSGIIIHFFLQKWLKMRVADYFIRNILK